MPARAYHLARRRLAAVSKDFTPTRLQTDKSAVEARKRYAVERNPLRATALFGWMRTAVAGLDHAVTFARAIQ